MLTKSEIELIHFLVNLPTPEYLRYLQDKPEYIVLKIAQIFEEYSVNLFNESYKTILLSDPDIVSLSECNLVLSAIMGAN
jgi:hypothetical protein